MQSSPVTLSQAFLAHLNSNERQSVRVLSAGNGFLSALDSACSEALEQQ